MVREFVTADLHLGHYKIIQYTKRPFAGLKEMHQTFLDNWNSRVNPGDIVRILGDLHMGTSSAAQNIYKIINNMNGIKHLILGNHDEMKPMTYINFGISSVHTSLDYRYEKGKCKMDIFMCHDPAWSQVVPEDHLVFCGHIHNLFKVRKNCVNVGVDVWNYTPILVEEAIDAYFDNKLEERLED